MIGQLRIYKTKFGMGFKLVLSDDLVLKMMDHKLGFVSEL